MTLRIAILLGWAAWFAPAQEPACHSVEADRIRTAISRPPPEVPAAPPETLLAQAPLPGAQRVFHDSELRMLAHRYGIALPATAEACFEWKLAPLDRAAALAAMQDALAVPEAKIEIDDLISDNVPPGRIEFPLSRLATPSPTGPRTPVLWRGDVIYGEGHRFGIWARVGITAPCKRLVAAENLRAGKPIEARQVRTAAATCFPVGAKPPLAIDQVAGLVPLRPIAPNTELRADLLAPPNDVERGDTVHVEVRSGGARLTISGQAVTAGRSGDLISIRNPDTNKTFPARVTGKDTALLDLSASKGI